MSDAKKFLGGILVGAFAGAALALFLKSEKGKAFVEEAKKKANDLQEAMNEKVVATEADLQALLEKGKAFVKDLEQKLQQNQHG